jgi:catechol-2,3-dioxygenase
MDRGIYESNRKVYIDWLDGLPRDITIGHVHAASQGAQNIATSYIGKLGLTAGLFAVLAKYKSTHPCDLAG